MEILALTHVAIDYEDPGPAPELRTFDDINLSLPKSAILGAAGSAAALSVMATAPDAQAVIMRGDICQAVTDLQSALVSEGGQSLIVDGNFGPGTEQAVINFQSSNSLIADGIAGPSTADALGLAAPGSPFEFGNGCGDGSTGGGGTATVDAGVLNIRNGPGTNFDVVSSLSQGDRVTVIETSGGWSRITNEGWVSSAYLIADGGSSGGGDGTSGTATVDAGVLNIRSGPGTDYVVIGELFQGTSVDVLSTLGDWSQISSSIAGEAWVSSAYLSTGGSTGGGGTIISTPSSDGANVRSFPDGPRVYGLPDGAVVRLNGATRFVNGLEWSQLNDGNWIASFVLL